MSMQVDDTDFQRILLESLADSRPKTSTNTEDDAALARILQEEEDVQSPNHSNRLYSPPVSGNAGLPNDPIVNNSDNEDEDEELRIALAESMRNLSSSTPSSSLSSSTSAPSAHYLSSRPIASSAPPPSNQCPISSTRESHPPPSSTSSVTTTSAPLIPGIPDLITNNTNNFSPAINFVSSNNGTRNTPLSYDQFRAQQKSSNSLSSNSLPSAITSTSSTSTTSTPAPNPILSGSVNELTNMISKLNLEPSREARKNNKTNNNNNNNINNNNNNNNNNNTTTTTTTTTSTPNSSTISNDSNSRDNKPRSRSTGNLSQQNINTDNNSENTKPTNSNNTNNSTEQSHRKIARPVRQAEKKKTINHNISNNNTTNITNTSIPAPLVISNGPNNSLTSPISPTTPSTPTFSISPRAMYGQTTFYTSTTNNNVNIANSFPTTSPTLPFPSSPSPSSPALSSSSSTTNFFSNFVSSLTSPVYSNNNNSNNTNSNNNVNKNNNQQNNPTETTQNRSTFNYVVPPFNSAPSSLPLSSRNSSINPSPNVANTTTPNIIQNVLPNNTQNNTQTPNNATNNHSWNTPTNIANLYQPRYRLPQQTLPVFERDNISNNTANTAPANRNISGVNRNNNIANTEINRSNNGGSGNSGNVGASVSVNLNSNLNLNLRGNAGNAQANNNVPVQLPLLTNDDVIEDDEAFAQRLQLQEAMQAQREYDGEYRNVFGNSIAVSQQMLYEELMAARRQYGRRGFEVYEEDYDSGEEDEDDVDHMTYEELLALGDRIGHVSKGASMADIEKCPKFSLANNAPVETCLVCQDEMAAGNVVRRLPCTHLYHATCIDTWLVQNPTCPVCKHTIKNE